MTSDINGYYKLDPDHTSINFTARHAMISRVHGTFQDWEVSLYINDDSPEASTISATIDASSLTTRQPQRDAHLRSPDFLDVRAFPTLTFESTKVEFQGSDTLYVTGDLTIKGTTREVLFNVAVFGAERDQFGNSRVGFEATLDINRKDFGVEWNTVLDSGNVLVSEEIHIVVDGSALRNSEAPSDNP
ncbi:YceI family protein [Corynebacterium sp. S7]